MSSIGMSTLFGAGIGAWIAWTASAQPMRASASDADRTLLDTARQLSALNGVAADDPAAGASSRAPSTLAVASRWWNAGVSAAYRRMLGWWDQK